VILIRKNIEQSDFRSWPDNFLRLAFINEIALSLWGKALMLHSKNAPYMVNRGNNYLVSPLPPCFLPLDCLICNEDLGITAKTYAKAKSKIYCNRCKELKNKQSGFSFEQIPEYMKPYKTLPARQWGKLISEAFHQLDLVGSEHNQDVAFWEKTFLLLKDAYAFFLSQYNRPYRIRYSLFHSYPSNWVQTIYFAQAMGKVVYLKLLDPYPEPQTKFQLSDKEATVFIPPIFDPAIEEKPISGLRDLPGVDVIEFSALEQYLIKT